MDNNEQLNSSAEEKNKGVSHKRFLGLLAFAVVLAVVGFFYDRGIQPESQDTPAAHEVAPEELDISLRIDKPDGDAVSRQITDISEGMTAFDLFSLGDVEITYDDYSFGKLVTSIDGIENGGEDDMYWIYYINGERAQVGSDSYMLQPGDEIRWQYEENIYK